MRTKPIEAADLRENINRQIAANHQHVELLKRTGNATPETTAYYDGANTAMAELAATFTLEEDDED